MIRSASNRLDLLAAVSIIWLAAPAPAPAQAQAQTTARDTEIQSIRAEMTQLDARLHALEAADAASNHSAPPAQGASTTIQVTTPQESAVRAEPSGPEQAMASPGKTPPPVPSGRLAPGGFEGLKLNAGTGDGSAELTLSRSGGLTPDQRTNWLTPNTEEISVSAPLSKSGGPTSVSTLNALASGVELKLKFGLYARRVGTGILSPAQLMIVADAQEACLNDLKHFLPVADCKQPDKEQAMLEHYAAPRDVKEIERTVNPSDWAFAAGLTGGVGYNRFQYLDANAAKQSIGKPQFEAGGFVSLFPTWTSSSLSLSFDYQHAYKDADSAVLCPSAAEPSSSTTKCNSGPIGKPDTANKALLAIDYRLLVGKIWFLNQLAIDPQFTFDAKSHEKAIDVPIYLVPDEKGHLLGGVRFGYGTSNHTFVAGVFIDAPFSLTH